MMTLSWRVLCLALCYAVVVAVGGAHCQAFDSGNSELDDDQLARIASEFIFGKGNKTLTQKIDSKELRTRSDGTTFLKVTVDNYRLMIDPNNEKVIGWQIGGSHIPTKTNDGRPVTRQVFEEELVQETQDQAKEAAIEFVTQRFGNGHFDHLSVSRLEKRITGQGYYWFISWRDRPNKAGYHVGEKWINVMVNPIDGVIVNGLFLDSDVCCEPHLSVIEARGIAEKELQLIGLAGCAEEESIRLIETYREGESAGLEWRFEYQVLDECKSSSLGSQGNAVKFLRVEDSSGTVIY